MEIEDGRCMVDSGTLYFSSSVQYSPWRRTFISRLVITAHVRSLWKMGLGHEWNLIRHVSSASTLDDLKRRGSGNLPAGPAQPVLSQCLVRNRRALRTKRVLYHSDPGACVGIGLKK